MTMIAKATSGGEREALVSSVTTLITELMRTLLWCVRHQIQVVSFRGWRGIGGNHVTVVVLPSPTLHILFGDNCGYQRRAVDGEGEVFTWFGILNGIRIEWEERS